MSSHDEVEGDGRRRPSEGDIGYCGVLALLVVSYGLSATQQSTNPSPIAFMLILATVAVVFRITGANAVLQRKSWVILSVAGVGAVVAVFSGTDQLLLDIGLSAAMLVALLIAPVAIIAHQICRRGLKLEALLAAITAYALVEIAFAFAFNLLGLLSPHPVFGEAHEDSLAHQLFFSFTTLTTTGYGNLVPETTAGQTIAVVEAVTGQLFLITAFARILRGATAPREQPPSWLVHN
ncbi:ion channel [Microbacterium sp. NPDC008134]|uniref:ion channel n=1 Tax=Microbacterium sp. NPDC008134 TaxID=3364183 RepID=UPI0036E891CA